MSINFLNDLKNKASIISNKELKIKQYKNKYLCISTNDITINKIDLKEMIEDIEFIIKTALEAIEKIIENSNTQNNFSNEITFSPITYNTTETYNTQNNNNTCEDNQNINETIQNYTKELKLQFDYSIYAGLYTNKQSSLKDEELLSTSDMIINDKN